MRALKTTFSTYVLVFSPFDRFQLTYALDRSSSPPPFSSSS